MARKCPKPPLTAYRLRSKRFSVKFCDMDIYDAALRRLKADDRAPAVLKKEIGIPAGTLRDIKKGLCENPRVKTVKKIVAYYFPKAA